MRKGLLCVNAFVNSPKFDEIYHMLIQAAQERGIVLKKITNAAVHADIWENKGKVNVEADFVIFWDKDTALAHILENQNIKLFNCASAIECCDNKILTFAKLLNTDIKMPRTYSSPKTFLQNGFESFDFLPADIDYPVVMKEAFGSFGRQVFLAENADTAMEIAKSFKNRPFIIQEFIASSKGRDIRIHVVGGKAVAAMLRYNKSDFRANITNGGSMEKYIPTSDEEEMAIKAANYLSLDFGGIDILFGSNGPLLCEVNSNAHFKNIYDCTGINVAQHIIRHIEKKIYG